MNNTEVTEQKQNADLTAKKAVLYDFRVPKKFTKEDVKALNRITDAFAKHLSSGLTTMTRENCSVYNPRIEEIRTTTYLESLPKYTMIGLLGFTVIDSDFRDPRVMFHIPPALSFLLIDILLGGPGKEVTLERQHTDIEVAIMKNLITRFCDMLKEAWSSLVTTQITYEKSETNPKLIDVRSESDVRLVMSFDVSVKNSVSAISIAYSAQFLEDLMEKLHGQKTDNQNFEPVDAQRDARRREQIVETLSESSIELRAVFAELTLDMQEVMSLKVGDIIPLDKKLTDDITIVVDDVPWFKAKLGQTNIKKAVKITESIYESNE